MQVFKTFFKIAWSYKPGLFLYLGICAFMTFMVAAQFGNSEGEVKYGNESYHIAVVDKDHSTLSNAFVKYLKKQHTVEEKAYDKDLVKDLIYYTEISAYITIPDGFEKNHLEKNPLKVESLSDSGQAAGVFINIQLSSYLESVARFERAGFSLEDAVANTEKSVDFEEFVEIPGLEKENSHPNNSISISANGSKLYSLFLFLPYPVMTILLSCVLPVILVFREKEIRNRTSISAVSETACNIALAAGGAVVSLLVFLGLTIFTSCFLGEDVFHGKWAYAVLNLFLFTVVTAMLLILMASFSFLGIRKAMDVLTNIIALGFSFLGGIFVPLSVLGNGVKTVGKFLPTYWYAVSLERIDAGKGFSELAGCFSMELLFGVVCLALGLAVVNLRKS